MRGIRSNSSVLIFTLKRWEIQPPIHVATIRLESTLVKHHFVLSPTNYQLLVKDRFC